jgi:immune inhibitor A
MTIVAADGNLLSLDNTPHSEAIPTYYNYFLDMHGDPFPGTAQVDSLTDDMLRKDNAQMLFTYTGKLNKPIYNIKEDENGVITFDFMKKFPTTGIAGIVAKDTENDNRIFTLDGRYVGTDPKALTRGIYIIGKRKISVQ